MLDLITSLNVKEKILSVLGVVLLIGALISGSPVIIIGILFIAIGIWGYVYFSIASRLQTSIKTNKGASARKDREPVDETIYDSIDDLEINKVPGKPAEANLSQLFSMETDEYPSSAEPRTEFDFLLGKVLAAIKEALIAHTVAFFWTNFEKGQLIFQGRASDSHYLKSVRKLPLDSDIVSQIARNGKPEVITHINPGAERDILPYYQEVEFVKSFIGVPVFYLGTDADRPVVGVLAIDSKAEDAFGSETLSLLGQFTKLLAALIKSHTEKYDLLVDSELLSSIRKMQESMRDRMELRSIIKVLTDQVKKLIGYDYCAVIMFNDDRHTWVVYHVDTPQGGGYILPNQTVDMGDSLVQKVLQSNTHIIVDDLSAVTIPRYNTEEKIDSSGSILIMPVSSMNKCYGTVSVERRDRSAYSRRDVEVLYRLTENTAAALEILYMSEVIDKYVIIDDTSGLLRKNYFDIRLEEEIRRADDTGADLTYAMFSIDNIQGFIDKFGKDGLDTAIFSFAQFLKQSVRPYDLVGRLDYNRFGVVLVQTPANDGYLWAEKLRKNFAAQVLSVNTKSVSVAVSSGVCGLTDSMHFAELTQHTAAALQKAIDSGGNIVRVY